MGSKGLRIIGFKPQSRIPMWASVKKSTFIYPSEESYVGSTRVFSALWQKLLKSKKVGIAWFISRANANPVMVAIIPSGHLTEDGSETPYLPAGLWLYPLPFADDIRSVEIAPRSKTSDDLTDKMREIVQNLHLPKGLYNPLKYPNPSLQWHYKILQALALEDEVPKNPEDLTIPKYRQIDKRVGGYMGEWKEALGNMAQETMRSRAVKRDAEMDVDDEPPTKRSKPAAKKAATGGHLSNAELKTQFEKGSLEKLKVAELKEILLSKGLNATGKKADLLEKLEQWIEENL